VAIIKGFSFYRNTVALVSMKKIASHSNEMIDFSAQLRAHGLRVTRSAIGVLTILSMARSTKSHDELANSLLANDEACDRVTLYRVLDRLTQVGLIKKLQSSDRVSRFALINHETSGYFECDDCHHLEELPEDPEMPKLLEQLNQRLKKQGIKSADVALTVHGTCRECDQKK